MLGYGVDVGLIIAGAFGSAATASVTAKVMALNEMQSALLFNVIGTLHSDSYSVYLLRAGTSK
jgi:hypothetical protein